MEYIPTLLNRENGTQTSLTRENGIQKNKKKCGFDKKLGLDGFNKAIKNL